VAVDVDVTAANEQAKPAWLELALAEYKALRDEILTTMETQQGTLRFGTAALSILVVGSINVWEDELVTTLAFLFAIPFLSKLVITIWMGEVTRMMRAGDHLVDVERSLQKVYPEMPEPIMRWETRLRDRHSPTTRWKQHYEWNYLAIILMFWTIAVGSMALGVYRGISGGLHVSDGWVWGIGGLVFLSSFVGLLLILSQLATVTHTQGVLRFLRRGRDDVGVAKAAAT
jgi:hypothetical protein